MRLLPVLMCAAALPWTAQAVDTGDFRWHGRLKPGDVIELKGINGAIVAQPATGNEVEVSAHKTGRRSDPNQVRVEVSEHAGGVTICALYPDAGLQRNVCKPGNAGHNSSRDNDVKVEFTVRVPAGVRFVGRTVNGNIETGSLKSDVEAYTVNGNVKLNTAGTATAAKTVNGSVEAALGKANWTRPAEFSSVNGGVSVELPSKTSADVHASTVNGSIKTDFPLAVEGKFVGRRINGRLGNGGQELKISTVNGSIRLRQQGGPTI
jgi:Putative adhesin